MGNIYHMRFECYPVFDLAFVLVFVLASQTDAEWMFLFPA